MARSGRFNPRQKRDSHGRWTKGGSSGSKARSIGSSAGSGAKKFGKFLVTPRTLPGRANQTDAQRRRQVALHVAVALAPLALAGIGGLGVGIGKLDTFTQTATQNKMTANQANYDRVKRAATFGVKVGQSSLKYANKRRGNVYNISDFKGRKV